MLWSLRPVCITHVHISFPRFKIISLCFGTFYWICLSDTSHPRGFFFYISKRQSIAQFRYFRIKEWNVHEYLTQVCLVSLIPPEMNDVILLLSIRIYGTGFVSCLCSPSSVEQVEKLRKYLRQNIHHMWSTQQVALTGSTKCFSICLVNR